MLSKHVELSKKQINELIETPPSEDLGDYSFPCFILSKKHKKSPKDISQGLVGNIKPKKSIEKIKAIGPYINFFINKKVLAQEILQINQDYGKSDVGKGKTIAIDFSGPNIGKPMHIGHIRSTILGDSLMRLFDFQDYRTVGINYLGDVGLHIGKLITAYELWLDENSLKKDPVKELLRLYIKFCEQENTPYQEGIEEEFQENEWTNKAKEKLKLLELGDKKTHKIWESIQKHSKKGFNKVYNTLNVNFHETTGQSLFSEKGKQVITLAIEQGKAKIEKDSAVYIDLPDLPKKYVLRSNGTASYITYDLGAAIERHKKYNFDKMIYITDFRQSLHFQQLFAILKKLNFNFSSNLQHLGFGTVNFGKEIIATRTGKIILLEDVLKKTIEKAEKEIKKRKTKGNPEKLGVGALKYSFLKNEPVKDVNFSWEQALNFEGDTGPYLQYAYARAASILRKSKFSEKSAKPDKQLEIPDLHTKEIKLLKKISNFPEIITQSTNFLNPGILAHYSFELAQTFSEFYHDCPVIGSKEQNFRLALVNAFKITLKNSLYLLGIEVMEEM